MCCGVGYVYVWGYYREDEDEDLVRRRRGGARGDRERVRRRRPPATRRGMGLRRRYLIGITLNLLKFTGLGVSINNKSSRFRVVTCKIQVYSFY